MANYKVTKRAKKNKDGEIVSYKNYIVVDWEKITSAEEREIQMYLSTGNYTLDRRRPAKKTGKGLTKEKIEKYLKEHSEEGLKEYKARVTKKENFMKTMQWFKQKFPDAEKELIG